MVPSVFESWNADMANSHWLSRGVSESFTLVVIEMEKHRGHKGMALGIRNGISMSSGLEGGFRKWVN